MSDKFGKIIAFSDNTASILEEGGGRRVYKFNPQKVQGNLPEHDGQSMVYVARLVGSYVKFVLDDAKEEVISVSIFSPVFTVFICQECSRKNYTTAAKECVCGNISNSIYKQCEACAVEKGECASCGISLQ